MKLIAHVFLLAAASTPAQEKPTPPPAEESGASRYQKGEEHFFAGRMKEALTEWDAQVKADPASLAGHWQRGLALYYARRFQDGRVQFEEHQKVNPEDVENAVWHFLCVSKLENVEAARKAYIPITRDRRVPMKQIHALFAGTGSAEEVMKAAGSAGGGTPEETRMPLCYAHLYLGLYYEALGKENEAKTHMLKAANLAPAQSYMGQVAVVHCKVRNWKAEAGK